MGIIISFVFGLIWGSFLNVVILRFDDWRSIVTDRSRCPKCKNTLQWYDLVPIMSYITLRGKCRYCQKPISWQYPIVELSTAALLGAGYYLIFVYYNFELWQAVVAFSAYIIAIGAMITIIFHDLYQMMVPDLMGYVLLISGIIFGLVRSGSVVETIYGGLVGVIPIALLVYPSRGKWMGEGDVKIAAACGLMLGYPLAIVFIITAFLIGGLFGAIALITKAVKLRTAIPFTPFLILATIITLFFGFYILNWYLGVIQYGY